MGESDKKPNIVSIMLVGLQESLVELLKDPTVEKFDSFSESVEAAQMVVGGDAKWDILSTILGTLPEDLRAKIIDTFNRDDG